MNRFISGCFCAVCAVMLTGCATAGKAEKVGRIAAAGIFEGYMRENKAKIVLEGCTMLDQNYEALIEGGKKAITK